MSMPDPSDNTPDLVAESEEAVRVAVQQTLTVSPSFRYVVRLASSYGVTYSRLAELSALDETDVLLICDPLEDAA